jgi:hypothetical protein
MYVLTFLRNQQSPLSGQNLVRGKWSTLTIEAGGSSETLVDLYRTTRRHIPENNNLQCHSRVNVTMKELQVITTHSYVFCWL